MNKICRADLTDLIKIECIVRKKEGKRRLFGPFRPRFSRDGTGNYEMLGNNLFIFRTYFTRKTLGKFEKFRQPAQNEKNMVKVTKFEPIFCENGI